MKGLILRLRIFNQFLIFPKKKQNKYERNISEWIFKEKPLRHLLLKAKRFEKMYSKKTDARGILPNTFRLLRKN